MCDYSLEMYASRAAKEGDKLITTRFPSGSMGMVEPGKSGTAVCLACDTVLKLDLSNPNFAALRERHGFKEVEAATFIHLTTGIYRDGLRFENGVELSLQQLPPGITAEVAPAPVIAAPQKQEVADSDADFVW